MKQQITKSKQTKSVLRILLAFISFLSLGQVHATAIKWVGGTAGNWSNTASWSPAQIPTSSDDVTFDNSVAGNTSPTVTLTADLGTTSVLSLTFTSSNVTFVVGAYTPTNPLIMTNMTLTASTVTFAIGIKVNNTLSVSGGSIVKLCPNTTTGPYTNTIGNGTTGTLSGMNTSNYFQGATTPFSSLAFNGPSSSTAFSTYFVSTTNMYSFNITKGVVTIGGSIGISRLTLQSTGSMVLGSGAALTLTGSGTSAYNGGTIDASNPTSSVIFTGAIDYSALSTSPFSANTINSFQIFGSSATVVKLGTGNTIKNLVLTSGILDNASQNITMADGGTITKAGANFTAIPIFGTSSAHRVNVVYGSNLSTGIELLGSPGKVGNLTVNDACTVYPSNSGLKSIAIGGTLTGYTLPTVTVAAPNTGGPTATLKVLTSGTAPNMTITGVVVTNPGSGYTTTPVFTLSDATGSGATFTPTFNTTNPTVDSIIVGNGASGTLNFPNSTNAVTLTVNKGIRVQSGGTFTTGAQTNVVSHQLLVGGCINNSGTFTLKGSGATKSTDLTLNGTGTQLLSGTPLFYKVSITNTTTPITTSSALDFTTLSIASGAILNMGTFDMTGSSLTTSGTGTLKTQSTSTTPIPSVTYTFTVEYNNATGSQSVIGTTYGGLTISNTSGSNNATSALTVNGTLNIASNASLNMSTYQLLGTISNTGLGLLQTANTTVPPIPSGITWSGTVSFTSNSNQTVPAGSYNNLTLAGTRTGSGSITLIASGTINISGTLSPIATFSTGNYVVTNNTIVFNGASTQIIPSFTFNNLTISNANASITSGGTLIVNALFTVDANFTQNVNSTINANGGITINSGTNFTIDATGSAVAVNAANSINAVLNNGSSSTITNNGTLTINGYFKNSSTTSFAGSYSVANNAVVEHAVNGGNLPIATWAANSYLYFTAINASIPSNTAQSFGNILWNCSAQSSGLQSINPTAIKGKLVVLNTNGKNITLSNNAINAANSISIDNGITVGSGASGYSFNNTTITTTSALLSLNINNTSPSFPPTIVVTGDVTVGSASGTAQLGTIRAASLSLTGNWNINAGGTFAQTSITVIFNGSSAQNINAATTFNALTIANSGAGVTLGNGAALTVNADLTLTSGILADGGNTITLLGNLAGTGTHTGSGKIYMTGASKTISGATLGNLEIASSGTVTASAGITVNGNLTLTSGTLADAGFAITVGGNLAGTATHSGTGKISLTGSSTTISGLTVVNLEIVSSGTITASASPTISGILTLTSGTLSDGGNTITVSGGIAGTGTHIGTGEIKIIGSGTRTISAVTLKNLENASSSGTINISGATIDALTLTSGTVSGTSNVLSALNFNGGGYGVGTGNTLTLYNGTTVTRNSSTGNFTTSSGVVKWGTSSSDLVNITMNVTASNGAEINGSETPGSIGTLTIANGANYNWTSGRNVTNLVNNGTLSMAGTCSIKGTISGLGSITSSTASLTLSGATNGNNGTLYFTNGSALTNLTINKTGTNASVTLGSPVTLLGNLALTAGTLDNASSSLTLSNSSTITRTSGAITASPVFGSTVNVTYNSASSTTTSFEIPTNASVLSNLTVSNGGGIVLSNSATVNGVLSLTSGKITLGNNNLYMVTAASISGTPSSSKYVVINGTGTFTRQGIGNVASLFPIGTATSYTPLTITNTTDVSDITTSVSNTITNAPADATKVANVQWSVTENVATTATILFQLNSTDKAVSYTVGTNELGNFKSSNGFYTSSSITTSGNSPITGTATGIQLGATVTNLFVIGNSGAVASFTAPTITSFSNIIKNFGDAAFTITAPTSNSSGAFTYNSSNTSAATISGSTVTLLGVGSTTITANQAAYGNYLSGSTTATLTVNAIVPSAPASITPTADNAQVFIDYTAPISNGGASIIDYTITAIPSSGSNLVRTSITANPYTFTGLTNGITYTFTITARNSIGTGATITSIATTPSATTIWNGTSWSAGTPDASQIAVIAAPYTSNTPIICTKLTINSGINFTNNSTITATSSPVTINGTVSGTGSIVLGGSSAQTITGTGTVNNLTLNNTAGASVTGSLGITGELNLQSGTFNTGDNIILKSTSIENSGILAPIAAGATISGKITVERYIPKGFRAFRDLSANGVFNPSNTLFNTWQESGVNHPGYGMFITGGAPDSVADHIKYGYTDEKGIDRTLSGYSSAYYYKAGWDTVTDTKNTPLNPYQSYRVLVRGDRNFNLDTTGVTMISGPTQLAMQSATTLRATGVPVTGDVTYRTTGVTNAVTGNTYNSAEYGLNSSPSGYTYLANPYACPVVFDSIFNNSQNIKESYYYLDPTIGSTGAYVSFNVLAGVSSKGATEGAFIQAGQGFLIGNTSSSPVVVLKERFKATGAGVRTSIFGTATQKSKLVVSLVKQSNVTMKMDAAVAVFSPQFSNGVGAEDNSKFSNASDNLSITESGHNLSIDGRLPATTNDVLGITLGQLSGTDYSFVIDASGYTGNGLSPYLVDAFTNKTTALKAAVDTIDFKADAKKVATYQNRFSIIFKPTTLPVNSIVANATANGNVATIKWNTVGENGVSNYEVEKSTDAKNFTKIGEEVAKNIATARYSATDKAATAATNYYRIKAVSTDGTIAYSNVVILTTNNSPLTTIYPNPLTGQTLNIQLGNLVAGKYAVSFYNSLGQKVTKQVINHAGGNGTHTVSFNTTIAAGVYNIVIRDVNSKEQVFQSTLSIQ